MEEQIVLLCPRNPAEAYNRCKPLSATARKPSVVKQTGMALDDFAQVKSISTGSKVDAMPSANPWWHMNVWLAPPPCPMESHSGSTFPKILRKKMGKGSLEERRKSGSKVQGSAGRENGTGSHAYTKKHSSPALHRTWALPIEPSTPAIRSQFCLPADLAPELRPFNHQM